MLCCAVLCCAVLCCAVLCCAVLCCAVLCCASASTDSRLEADINALLKLLQSVSAKLGRVKKFGLDADIQSDIISAVYFLVTYVLLAVPMPRPVVLSWSLLFPVPPSLQYSKR